MIAVGFAGGAIVFGIVLWVVGIDGVVRALRDADPAILAAVFLVATFWLLTWALSLRTVLDVLGVSLRPSTVVPVYAAAIFANNVTPFGQAGGEPVSAWFISEATETRYETGLVAIASVDALHFVPSIFLGLVGLGYYAVTITFGRQLEVVGTAVGALALAIPALAYAGWTRRYALEERTVAVVVPAVRTVASALPGTDAPTERSVRERIEEFYAGIERVAADRRGLGFALGYSAAGWFALAVSLWLSLFALGYAVPFAATLVAIPVGDLAAFAPLPGGLGGVEALLVGVLVVLPGTPGAEVIGAAVLIHRAAVYLLPTIGGGGSAAVITARR